ncbi:cystathionine gamma-synthase [Xylariales sp. PMI_506]|nr:cystathionine gamma-synthase [Xylariales sp. PMI_506]
MPVPIIDTPIGHSIPPQGPHTVTIHAPTWEHAKWFRDADPRLIAQLKSIYPRFFPFGPSAEFVGAIAQKIGLAPDQGVVPFLDPDLWQINQKCATSHFRKENILKEEELKYHVAEVDGTRLYLVQFPSAKQMGAVIIWQHGGLGFSTRFGEYMLAKMDTFKYIGEFPGGLNAPSPTWLPESESHGILRQRVASLRMLNPVQDYVKKIQADDVYLYHSGMGGIARFMLQTAKVKTGLAVVFGAVFHSTWDLFEEVPASGFKHYGKCEDSDLDDFEKYLEGGGKCSFVFTEFPSNPILTSVDILRLRKLADKYGFWLVVDDTVSSFCNIDVLPVADVVVCSLTKYFSGYANLLCGSVVLNPNFPSYDVLKPIYTEVFRNEFFALDADQLVQNSEDYLERLAVCNSTSTALTKYLQGLAEDPKSAVTKVLYPPYSQGSDYLEPFLCKPTPQFPNPGYGGLFSVEFDTPESTEVFYENLQTHKGPHFGAPLTLATPYNFILYSKEDQNAAYHSSYGLDNRQIRVAVGQESEAHLLEVFKSAIDALPQVEES